jgi:hypothetical protein
MSYTGGGPTTMLRSASYENLSNNESSNESSSLGSSGSSSDERLDTYAARSNSFNRSRYQYNCTREGENVRVNGDNTVINLNSMYQLSVIGPSFTQVVNPPPVPVTPSSYTSTPSYNSTPSYRQEHHGRGHSEPPPKEVVMPLYMSDRVINEKDVLIVSKNLGNGWRDVGTRLLFRPKQLDSFEQDSCNQQKLCEKMLLRWREWKDTRATIGRLTKCLFLAEEFDAIVALSP